MNCVSQSFECVSQSFIIRADRYLIFNLTHYSTSDLYGVRIVIKVINLACNLKTVLRNLATTVSVSKQRNVSNGCKLRSLSSVFTDLFTPYYDHQTRSTLDSLTCSQRSSAVWKLIPWGAPVGDACRLCHGSACGLALYPLSRRSYGFGLYNYTDFRIRLHILL